MFEIDTIDLRLLYLNYLDTLNKKLEGAGSLLNSISDQLCEEIISAAKEQIDGVNELDALEKLIDEIRSPINDLICNNDIATNKLLDRNEDEVCAVRDLIDTDIIDRNIFQLSELIKKCKQLILKDNRFAGFHELLTRLKKIETWCYHFFKARGQMIDYETSSTTRIFGRLECKIDEPTPKFLRLLENGAYKQNPGLIAEAATTEAMDVVHEPSVQEQAAHIARVQP